MWHPGPTRVTSRAPGYHSNTLVAHTPNLMKHASRTSGKHAVSVRRHQSHRKGVDVVVKKDFPQVFEYAVDSFMSWVMCCQPLGVFFAACECVCMNFVRDCGQASSSSIVERTLEKQLVPTSFLLFYTENFFLVNVHDSNHSNARTLATCSAIIRP